MRISVIDTLVYTWREYRERLLLLICASAVYSSPTLIRYYVDPINSIAPSTDHFQQLLDAADDPQTLTQAVEVVTDDLAAQEAHGRSWSWPLVLMSFLFSSWLFLGMIRICLDSASGRHGSFTELFLQGDKLPVFLAGVLLIAILFAGCLVMGMVVIRIIAEFISVPSWILGVAFLIGAVCLITTFLPLIFFGWVLIDQECGLFESFARSWKLMEGHRFKIALTLCCVAFIGGATYSLVYSVTRLLISWTTGYSYLVLRIIASWVGTTFATPIGFLPCGRLYRLLDHSKG